MTAAIRALIDWVTFGPYRRECAEVERLHREMGLRVVGWGPFVIPGEAKRLREARRRTEEQMALLDQLRKQER